MNNVFVSTSVLEDGMEADRAVAKLLEMDFTHIEIGSTHTFSGEYRKKIARFRERAVMTVHNYFPPAAKPIVLNLADSDKQRRQASIRQIQNSIDFCHELEIDLYSFHPGFIGEAIAVLPDTECRDYDFQFQRPDRVDRSSVFEVLLDSLKRICDHAAAYDMKIACENSGSISKNEFCLMSRQEEFEWMFESVDYPHLGVLLDLGHLRLASIANSFCPEDFIAAVRPKVYEVHVHENDGVNDQHSFLYPGCGVLGWLGPFDFSAAVITLEGRNLTPDQLMESYRLLKTSVAGRSRKETAR